MPAKRPLGAPLIALFLMACMPVVAPIEDGAPEGPQLVIQISNASGQEHEIGYQYEEFQSSGEGGGSILPCQDTALPYGMIGGRYSILLDGESLLEGSVPETTPANAWVVVRVRIAPDGKGEVTGTGITARMPDLDPRPIADCG